MAEREDADGRISVTEIDKDHLTVTGAHSDAPHVEVYSQDGHDQAIIIVNQVFGPKGDSLVGLSEVRFDEFPAVSVGVRWEGGETQVQFSPIHGDSRTEGGAAIPMGTKLSYFCPVSKEPLPRVGEVDDGTGARYFALFLTTKLEKGSMVMISDVWGHHHSRIVDEMELISHWANMEPAVRESLLPPAPFKD